MTWPEEGRINLFKQHLYCEHAAHNRVSGAQSSKHTGCPAKLYITVHRFDILTSAVPTGYVEVMQ